MAETMKPAGWVSKGPPPPWQSVRTLWPRLYSPDDVPLYTADQIRQAVKDEELAMPAAFDIRDTNYTLGYNDARRAILARLRLEEERDHG